MGHCCGRIPGGEEGGELEVSQSVVWINLECCFEVAQGIFPLAEPSLQQGHFAMGDCIPVLKLKVGLQFQMGVRPLFPGQVEAGQFPGGGSVGWVELAGSGEVVGCAFEVVVSPAGEAVAKLGG